MTMIPKRSIFVACILFTLFVVFLESRPTPAAAPNPEPDPGKCHHLSKFRKLRKKRLDCEREVQQQQNDIEAKVMASTTEPASSTATSEPNENLPKPNLRASEFYGAGTSAKQIHGILLLVIVIVIVLVFLMVPIVSLAPCC